MRGLINQCEAAGDVTDRGEAYICKHYGMCGTPFNSVLKFFVAKGHQRRIAYVKLNGLYKITRRRTL
jgi:hypothetical protein